MSDSAAITELINITCLADMGQTLTTTAELQERWKATGFDLNSDAWIAVSAEGKVVGYEELFNRHGHFHLEGDGYVHPQFQNLGIGTALLRKLEARARQHIQLAPPEMRARLRNGISTQDSAGRYLHEHEGYQAIRYFYWMRIQMESLPPTPHLPPGICLSTYSTEIGPQRLFNTLAEAFRDHWGQSPWSFDFWKQHTFDNEFFDPSLVFIAFDGEEIAGAAICRMRFEHGWVSTLGVRRPWRRRGVASALLRHSFRKFWNRGKRSVTLGVDATSLTNATRLYEKVGMRVWREWLHYEKELRPGEDLTLQSLDN